MAFRYNPFTNNLDYYPKPGPAAGSNKQVQYNDSNSLAGSEIEYDKTSKRVTFPDDVVIKKGKKLILDG